MRTRRARKKLRKAHAQKKRLNEQIEILDEQIETKRAQVEEITRAMDEKDRTNITGAKPTQSSSFDRDYIVRGGTAYLRKNEKIEPTKYEDLLNELYRHPNPAQEEIHVGSNPPSDAEVLREHIMNREQIFQDAYHLAGGRVPMDILERVGNSLFNDGFSLSVLKELAALTPTAQAAGNVQELLESAKITDVTVEHIEGLSSIARAVLKHILTHHGNKKPLPGLEPTKTPFIAWQVKETIQDYVARSKPIVQGIDGYNNMKQVDEFIAGFRTTDVVLWNMDIWNTAVRGHESFRGTYLTPDIIGAARPMFWQYDRQFALPSIVLKSLAPSVKKILGAVSGTVATHECIGFCILPTMEEMVELQFPEEAVTRSEDRPQYGDVLITVDEKNPAVRKAFENPTLRFKQRGISIGIICMPLGNGERIPEITFFRPMCEDQEVNDGPYSIFLAAIKFLTLKYVRQDTVPVSKKELKSDRHLFKQVRKGKKEIPPIKIINLRKPERRERTAKDEAKAHHYNCHFLVDAHWRAQWYPSEGINKTIRILGFVKGDMTKPFKPPREKVYKAVR